MVHTMMAKPSFESHFKELLSLTIDEAFSSLGETPKQALFFHLEQHFSVKPEKIVDNIEAFDSALKMFLGTGAVFLESLIVLRLCQKTGLPLQELPYAAADFSKAVMSVKEKIEK